MTTEPSSDGQPSADNAAQSDSDSRSSEIGTTQKATSQPKSRSRLLRRLVILLLIGIVAIIGVLAFEFFRFARPIGEGPAGQAVAIQPFEEVWSERPVVVLGLGDSVTAGFGVRQDLGYVARVVNNPPDEFEEMKGRCLSRVLPNLRTENLAVSGSTSIQLLDRLQREPPTFSDDEFGLVMLTTGGNDLIHNYGRSPAREGAMYGATLEEADRWIANFEPRLNEILDRIEAAFPGGCLIFLGDVYDPSDGVGDAPLVGLPRWPDGLQIHQRYNDVIHRVAESRENVVLVPMHAEFLGHGFHCTNWWNENYDADDPHYWYGAILEDPNERGFDALRRLFLNKIVENRERISRDESEGVTD